MKKEGTAQANQNPLSTEQIVHKDLGGPVRLSNCRLDF